MQVDCKSSMNEGVATVIGNIDFVMEDIRVAGAIHGDLSGSSCDAVLILTWKK